MILQEEIRNVDSSLGAGIPLQIASTPIAMRILSQTLYSRPIEAVLRELGTNAADAHIDAGTPDRPFEVSLPTLESPTLKVRDYGLGIHPDNVPTIFATYFKSTKNDSNEFNGCFGLGSKSPLAISDQFMIEIWYEGNYYVWNIYKNDNGIPCIPDNKPFVISPSTEPSGVQITVPISDSTDFLNYARTVYQYFKVIPIVKKGNTPVTICQPDLENYHDLYFFKKYSYNNQCHVLMGNVLYPINMEIRDLACFENLCFGNKSVIIPFQNGGVQFSANREALEYNKKTIAVLKRKYDEIVKFEISKIQEIIDKEPNAFRAYETFHRIANKNIVEIGSIQYQGKPLSQYFNGCSNYAISLWKTETEITNDDWVFCSPKGGSKKSENHNSIYLSYHAIPITIFYNDEKLKKPSTRINSAGKTNCHIINDKIDIDKWCELNFFDKKDILPISSIKKPVVERTYQYKKTAGVFRIAGGTHKTNFWKSIDNVPDSAYYIEKSDCEMVLNGELVFNKEWSNFARLDVFPTDLPILGVSRSYLKRYQHWKKLEDVVKATLEEKKAEVFRGLSKDNDAETGHYIDLIRKCWPESETKDIVKSIIKINNDRYLWREIYHTFGFDISDKETNKFKFNIDEIIKKYPLLKLVSINECVYNSLFKEHYITQRDKEIALVQDYIKLIDSKEGE